MKTIIRLFAILFALAVLAIASLVFMLAPRHFALLSSRDFGDYTVEVRGLFGKGLEIVVVAEDERPFFSTFMRCDPDCTVIFSDLNFDGFDDMTVVTETDGDVQYNRVFLFSNGKNNFTRSDELSAIHNLRVNAERGGLFGYEKETVYDADAGKPTAVYRTVEKVTKYVWLDGVLTPDVQISYTYYSETNMVLYQSAVYDEETHAFEYPADKWLTKAEYDAADLSYFYYFK